VSQPVSLTPSTSASQSAAASSAPAVAETPSQVVQAYYQAINEHRYQVAWQLGGKNTGQSYASFVAGFNGTASDVLLIGQASGDIVHGTLTANQTDGSIKTYSGSYTVQDGVITTFQVAQIAN
jgi:UDP-N-acetylmuramoylalanine-D-glutamate ligase